MKNYGLVIPEIQIDNWILGGISATKKVLNPSRDWRPFLPWGELQSRTIETSSCSEFGTLNGIETLEKRLFGVSSDYSERLVSIGAQNTPQGNSPHIVAEWIRHNGLVNETILPFTGEITSWEEYMTPNPLTEELLSEAKKWLEIKVFNHEWVFNPQESVKAKQEKLWESLRYSPIGISVSAWRKENDLYVKEKGEQDNHWCLLVGAKKNSHWIVFDSYMDDDFIKELEWDYDFNIAKSFFITKVYRGFLKNYLGCLFE